MSVSASSEADCHMYALISSKHAGLGQNTTPAYSMTLRITPEILRSLQTDAAAVTVRLGSENVLTVNGTKHALRSFGEKPTVCESYLEDDGRYFQVSGIYKKLIVKRDLREQAPNTSTEIKSSTDRRSIRSLESEGKRRRPGRSNLPTAKKQMRSSRGLPSPSLRRGLSSPSGPSRMPIAPRSSALTTSTKTPRSAASLGSSSAPLLGRSTKSPTSVAPSGSESSVQAPEPSAIKRKGASRARGTSSKAATNNEMPLVEQVIHLLAIQPMSITTLGRRLGMPGKKLEAYLRKVSNYEAPGKYFLKSQFFGDVNVDKWPYTDAEKEKVLQQCAQERHNMEVQKASAVQSGDDSTSKGSKSVQNSNSAIAHSVTAPIISKFSAVCTLDSHESYMNCRRVFEEGYPVYQKVDARLHEIGLIFEEANSRLDEAKTETERERIRGEVKSAYNNLLPERQSLQEVFVSLHEGVAKIKLLVKEYCDKAMKGNI